MPKVAEKMGELLAEGLVDFGRGFDEAPREALSEDGAHVPVA